MSAALPMAVEVAGEGEAVLLLHGLGGTSNTFQTLMGALAGRRAIRPDLPGSGRSPWPPEPLSIEALAEAVAATLAAMGVARAHVVAHSMGTLVAQHLAAARPDLVASLTLYGALTEPGEAARTGLVARAGVARAQGMGPIADQIVAGTLAPRAREEAPAALAFVRESILRQPPEGYARSCEALARATATDPRRIRAPTLLVTGDADPVAPVGMARSLADGIAGATLTVLDRCGHWVTMERPGEAARALAGMLAAHGVQRSGG